MSDRPAAEREPGSYRDPSGFISYPYEWSFSQLKDAALLTLEAQAAAA